MKKAIIFLACILSLTSCGTPSSINISQNVYDDVSSSEVPGRTIVIMPPINRTVNVEAKEYFYSSLAMPLCNQGYYVISPYLALETMKNESAYDSELFINGSLSKFHEVFGADLALFTIINEWSRLGFNNTITANIEYILKSTTTNKVLFHRGCTATIDATIKSDDNRLGAVLAGMAMSAINTASIAKIKAARECNSAVLANLPYGVYSSNYVNAQSEIKKDSVTNDTIPKVINDTSAGAVKDTISK